MKITNTFMHGDRVLRPGDAIPNDVSDSELLTWKNNGLIGDNYDGPTRRSPPAPVETKPAAPARKAATPKVTKPAGEPKPAETKADANAPASGDANPGDGSNPEDGQQQLAGAGAGAVDQSAQAASGVDQV